MTTNYNSGQTLVTLLFFMVISLAITTAAIVIIFVNMQAQTKMQQSQSAYYVAESGMENALVRLERDPTYTGENLTIGEGTASISTTMIGTLQSGTVYATSSGTVGNFVRTIQTIENINNNVFTVTSWKELF